MVAILKCTKKVKKAISVAQHRIQKDKVIHVTVFQNLCADIIVSLKMFEYFLNTLRQFLLSLTSSLKVAESSIQALNYLNKILLLIL